MQSKGKIVITGGSGYIGLNLAQYLIKFGYDVTIISRNQPKRLGYWKFVQWDGRSYGQWANELDSTQAIINLAGKSVDCVKTPDNCDLILRSRVETTQIIGQALRTIKHPPSVWVQMSTAHIYGDPPEVICCEKSPLGYGLAPFVGKAWEDAYQEAILPSMRQVILRTSFVIGSNGGALPILARLTRFGLGGPAGQGKQGFSWIHESDLNKIFLSAIENDKMEGIYIASAPNPVSNQAFMKSLRKTLRVPFGLPAKSWMVKLASLFLLKTDPELVLFGRYVMPKRLITEGFEFDFPKLSSALNDIYPSSGHLRRANGSHEQRDEA